MKILLRPRLCSQALSHRMAADADIARALAPEPNRAVGFLFKKFFDADSPLLDKMLALAGTERMSFLRDVQFSAAEIAQGSHVEVICRKTIGQTRSDADATHAAYDADTLHPTTSRWAVRLPRKIFLSKAPPANAISHVDQWTGEYVMGTEAADALRGSGLTGAQLLPVLHWRTGAAQDFAMHLSTSSLLPAAALGPSTFETFDDGPGRPSQPRRYGALSYAADALDASPDLARTAEPWGEWRTPVWVVRQRVREWYTKAGLVGWAFRPVLIEGTPLHAEHESRWQALLQKLSGAGAEVSA